MRTTRPGGLITDERRDGQLAICVCVHGKTWSEGDLFEPAGGACRECVEATP